MMNGVRWAVALILGLFLIFMGVQKFIADPNPIFATIADRSGLAFFEPWVRQLVGVAELVGGVMVILPMTRRLGGLLALAVIGGAIGFHLSPWLGISVVAEPGGEPTPALFYTAVVFFGVAVVNAIVQRR